MTSVQYESRGFFYEVTDVDLDIDALMPIEGRRLARVRLNGKFGYIDTAGNIIYPIVYTHLECNCNEQMEIWRRAENAQNYMDYMDDMREQERLSFKEYNPLDEAGDWLYLHEL